MAPARIETMTEADVEGVAALDATTRGEEARLREEVLRPWARLWVAREDGDGIVGFLASWVVVDELHILDVMTRADRRRHGVGRSLMQTALDYGRGHAVDRVLLEARRSNVAALALYRSMGFFVTGIRPRYYSDGEDAVEMALHLDPATREVVALPDEVKLDRPPS